ncbi:MAG: nucleotidyltransferase domain-containing protein [Bacteroidales bacterium]|nr:nucleotidyltransferase domain-containing protein [Bacteroidales bacterium]
MDKREVVNKLTDYKILLTKHFDLDKLILFGSYAKGSQREDSDIDVAVIVNSIDKDFFSYAPLLWRLRRNIDDRIEPILIDKHHDESGFLSEIIKTGLVI